MVLSEVDKNRRGLITELEAYKMKRNKISLIGGGQIGGNLALLAAQKELGDISDEKNELDELQKKIEETKLSKEALEKVSSEFSKLRQMSPMSAEATVVRTLSLIHI